jgi:YVTN family beta-propeller protein
MSYKYYFLFLFFIFACKKEDINDDHNVFKTFQNGLLVLNEGLFQQNNSTLSWVDLATDEVKSDVFLNINNRLLGDTGNDLKRYGGKIYIVVNASSTVDVIDAKTLKRIAQIDMKYNGVAQQPRYIDFYQNKAYVSSFDGYVNEIDTAQLTITNRIKVGENPDGLSISGGYLYVANSGGLNFPNVDTTVFQIDLLNLSVQDTFVVGNNPGRVVAHESGYVYVVKRGNYGSEPSELIKINTQNGTVENTATPASGIYRIDEEMYITYYNESTQNNTVSVFDFSTNSIVQNNIIDGSQIQTLYGVSKLPDGTIVCMDAMGYTNSGYLRFFTPNGSLKKSINVGLNPNNFLYYE